ncbi:MAG: hypothetical protein QNL62_00380 [Gammaproteobacteria bacterium]|nr:hypothetical protein [Gammaproteobacteria bacterium]
MLKTGKFNHFLRHYFLAVSVLITTSCSQGMSEQGMLENARDYLKLGELQAAAIELRNILQENSENAEARYLLGSISLIVGDIASAEKEFRRAALAGEMKRKHR